MLDWIFSLAPFIAGAVFGLVLAYALRVVSLRHHLALHQLYWSALGWEHAAHRYIDLGCSDEEYAEATDRLLQDIAKTRKRISGPRDLRW